MTRRFRAAAGVAVVVASMLLFLRPANAATIGHGRDAGAAYGGLSFLPNGNASLGGTADSFGTIYPAGGLTGPSLDEGPDVTYFWQAQGPLTVAADGTTTGQLHMTFAAGAGCCAFVGDVSVSGNLNKALQLVPLNGDQIRATFAVHASPIEAGDWVVAGPYTVVRP